jgi:hypothetical protein
MDFNFIIMNFVGANAKYLPFFNPHPHPPPGVGLG